MFKFKKVMASVLVASFAITAFAPAATADAAFVEAKGQIKSNKDVVTRIVNYSANNRDRLSTLIAAVTCKQFDGAIVDTLVNADKVTVFAPTNFAFAKLGRQLDSLLDLGIGPRGLTADNVCAVDDLLGEGTLATILTYHVTTPKIWYGQALKARQSRITMLSGEQAFVGGSQKLGRVKVDGQFVRVKNIRSGNGITHVLSGVMIPPSVEQQIADALAE